MSECCENFLVACRAALPRNVEMKLREKSYRELNISRKLHERQGAVVVSPRESIHPRLAKLIPRYRLHGQIKVEGGWASIKDRP
jgi:hypothetical protein